MKTHYELLLHEYGIETPVQVFATEREAAKFIVDHKESTGDDRLYTIEPVEVGELDSIGSIDHHINTEINKVISGRVRKNASNDI